MLLEGAGIGGDGEEDDQRHQGEECCVEMHRSSPLALEPGDGLGGLFLAHRRAGQRRDDLGGGFGGNLVDVLHGLRLGGGDAGVGLGELRRQGLLEGRALGLDFGRDLGARLGGDPLRIGAGIGQRLLVVLDRRLGLVLQRRGLREVALDGLVAVGQHRCHARQRHLAHQQVEQREEDHQPEDLGGEGMRVHRREAAVAAFRARALGGGRGRTLPRPLPGQGLRWWWPGRRRVSIATCLEPQKGKPVRMFRPARLPFGLP